jgi:hypothetical protein
MVILLIIMIPLTSIITGLLTLKTYNRGLTHAWDLKHDIKPTDTKNPIVNIMENKTVKQEEKKQTDLQEEWLIDPRD